MKTRVNLIIVLLSLVFVSSCAPPAKPLEYGDIIFDIDSAKAIREAIKDERKSRFDLFGQYAGVSFDTTGKQLDTFYLYDVHFACTCPNWADTVTWKDSTAYYYLDPADPSIELPYEFTFPTNTIRFYGTLLPNWGLPKYEELYGHPQDGPVIVYYGYEMIRPWTFWGPEVTTYERVEDTTSMASQLIVK